jgi:tricorn protease
MPFPRLLAISLFFVACELGRTNAAVAAPLLLQDPTISRTQIAFAYAGDIWTVDRAGGAARRLVTGMDREAEPIFSPDGESVAFSGSYDGIVSVYVVPAAGGEPRRLTSNPRPAVAVGWTPDGKNVLFRSAAESPTDPNMLFTVPVAGGLPKRVPLPMGEQGSFSPDGSHLAYVPNFRWEPFWKGYRGGQTTPVYIADLADSSIVRVPRDNSNDDSPMWLGDAVYFLSDRNGPVTLFRYDTHTQRVERVLANDGLDITDASAGAGAIVYSQFGSLHVFDPRTRATTPVHVTIAADLPQLRPHWVKVGDHIENASISPTGVRAVFEAHGQILTVPVEHGDIRNVSNLPHTANRDPAWSPDGRSIAYFSDASGEYALTIRDQRGLAAPRSIPLGPSFYYSPVWSPDSKKIAFSDKHLNLYYVDLDHPAPVKVATALTEGFGGSSFDVAWSPDSRWIAYANELPNFLHAAFVYELGDRRSRQITDGLSDVRYPVFDANGKYLYFTASTNTALTSQGLDMTSDQHPVSSSVYVAVLRRDQASPVKPETGDEMVKAADAGDEPGASPAPSAAPAGPQKPAAKKPAAPKTPEVTIDFDGILQRIVALPIPDANYVGLFAGKAGELFVAAVPLVQNEDGPAPIEVAKYDGATRKVSPFAGDLSSFALSANGEKALYERADHWFVTDAEKTPQPGEGALDTAGMEVFVDPMADWRQMYHEVWRIERDFFYDPHYHGLDLGAAERRFEPYLDGVGSRDDLNFLFEEMLSYLSVGHMFVRGGAEPPAAKTNVGLLGADYTVENGRYRFARIYGGENWNPELQAPLTQPGSDVKVGDYLIAVNGRHVAAADDLYSFFSETAGKQTIITVGPKPDGSGSHDVTVVPVANEFALRNLNWIEDNRRKVDELSGGRLGYVYLPDTGGAGFTNFNRYYFAQVGKEGVIIDERFNHGGQLADYIVDYLNRKPLSVIQGRDGRQILDPPLAIYGPKVMLINQFAGSGGDALPWYFRKEHVGTLVGVRTWGGLVGIGGYPTLIDGGTVTAPRVAIGGLHGQWEVENHGVAPDIEVFQDPKLVREGHDPQLEAGVKRALELLREHPLPTYEHPPYPDHKPVLPPVPQDP